MLNKELLMTGAEAPEVILTVGENASLSQLGFIEGELGSINKIPYWGSPSSYMKGLWNEKWKAYFRLNELVVTLLIMGLIIPSIPLNAGIYIEEGMDTHVFNGLIEWYPDTTYTVYFDPPPTGYLDPETLEPI